MMVRQDNVAERQRGDVGDNPGDLGGRIGSKMSAGNDNVGRCNHDEGVARNWPDRFDNGGIDPFINLGEGVQGGKRSDRKRKKYTNYGDQEFHKSRHIPDKLTVEVNHHQDASEYNKIVSSAIKNTEFSSVKPDTIKTNDIYYLYVLLVGSL
jgi:hypothetical protein